MLLQGRLGFGFALCIRLVAEGVLVPGDVSVLGNRGGSMFQARCRHPAFDPRSFEMRHFFPIAPLRCPGQGTPEPFVVDGGVVRVRPGYRCYFKEIVRTGARGFYKTRSFLVADKQDKFKFRLSDFASVRCVGPTHTNYTSMAVGIRPIPQLDTSTGWDFAAMNSLRVNVLILGFESMARPAFPRVMPKTFRFLMDKLKAIILHGYNTVGEHATPVLTGFTLDEWLRRHSSPVPLPNIWKEYKREGYVTVHAEDKPFLGMSVVKGVRGPKKQPTDHYMRHFYQSLPTNERHEQPLQDAYCLGSRPKHMFMFNYIKMAFKTYSHKPKFVYSFHSEMSHASLTAIGSADVDLRNTLNWLALKGHLNSTFVFLMGDHGPKLKKVFGVAAARQLYTMPFMAIVPPPWFKTEHPRLYANLLKNSNRLTTPYDVHATLKHFLDLSSTNVTNFRSQSLLKEISTKRTCRNADIPETICGCSMWKKINSKGLTVELIALKFVKILNHEISSRTSLCHTIHLVKVSKADILPTLPKRRYALQVVTKPGPAVFEVVLGFRPKYNRISFSIHLVRRINPYGDQPHCLLHLRNLTVDLRPFCYCKQQLDPRFNEHGILPTTMHSTETETDYDNDSDPNTSTDSATRASTETQTTTDTTQHETNSNSTNFTSKKYCSACLRNL